MMNSKACGGVFSFMNSDLFVLLSLAFIELIIRIDVADLRCHSGLSLTMGYNRLKC